jgi:hypothetical protein
MNRWMPDKMNRRSFTITAKGTCDGDLDGLRALIEEAQKSAVAETDAEVDGLLERYSAYGLIASLERLSRVHETAEPESANLWRKIGDGCMDIRVKLDAAL